MKINSFIRKYRIVFLIVLFTCCFVCGVYNYYQTPEKTVQNYIFSINRKDYNEAYDYLDIDKVSDIKNNFSKQLSCIEKDPQIDNYRYFSKITAKIKRLKITPISNINLKNIDNDIDLNSLAAIEEEYLYRCAHEKNFKKNSWGVFNVICYFDDNSKIITTVAVKRNESLLGKIFKPFLIIDPCAIKRLNIIVDKNTRIELDGIELSASQEDGIDGLLYVVPQLILGEHNIKLINPDAETFERKFTLSSFPKINNVLDLRGMLILKHKLEESGNIGEKKESIIQSSGYVNSNTAIIRKGPSFKEPLITKINKNSVVKILTKQELSEEEKKLAVLEKETLEILLNGDKKYKLFDVGPIKIIEKENNKYKCEVIMQGKSNFFFAPINEIHKLEKDSWYLIEIDDGRKGWIISKYISKKI